MTDREKLITLIWHKQDCGLTHNGTGQDFVTYNAELADHLLANGVVVRENGEWESCVIYTGNWINTCTYGSEGWACSVCGEGVLEKHNFCPNCGADMRGAANNG